MLHLSSFYIISLFTELVEQETKLTVKTKTKTKVTAAFERTVALKTQDPDKTILLLFYKIGICCFSTKHVALRRKSKDGLARNQDIVSEWGDMSI
jgi:hypothetical protein